MTKPLLFCTLFTLFTTLSFGQNGGYLLTNDNAYPANAAEIESIAPNGALRHIAALPTGGMGFTDMPLFAGLSAVQKNLKCFFVADAESNDIASFQIPTLTKVPVNFSNPQLAGDEYGMGLAATPNGKFLISAWSASGNLAVLAVAPDCSLSLMGSPISQPDFVNEVTVTPDGQVVVVGYPFLGGVQAYLISETGTLTPLGPQFLFKDAISACQPNGCLPAGQDVTNDGKYWVWGNVDSNGAEIITATLGPKGFANAALHSFPQTGLQDTQAVQFSPAGRTGKGNLYIGSNGIGANIPGGVIVTTFDHGTITYASSIVVTASHYAGNVQTIGTTGTGSPITQGWTDESNTYIQSYIVNGTTLTPAFTLQTNGGFAFSTGVAK